MSALTRYLNRLLLGRVAGAAAAVLLFALLFDLLEVSDDLVGDEGGAVLAFGRYVALRVPSLLVEALPVAALLGGLFLAADLAKRSELPVIRAMGVSPLGLLGRLWPVALLLVAFKLANDEALVPRSVDALRAWEVGDFEPGGVGQDAGRLWVEQDGAILRVPLLNAGQSGDGLLIFRTDEDGALIERIVAERAVLEGDRWLLQGTVRRYGQSVPADAAAPAAWPNEVPPERLRLLARPPQELGLVDLVALIRTGGYGVVDPGSYRTALWHRLGSALALPLLAVLGLAAAGRFSRRAGSGPMFVRGLSLGFGYLILSGTAVALSEAGVLTAVVAGVAPVLALAALVLLPALRAQRRSA